MNSAVCDLHAKHFTFTKVHPILTQLEDVVCATDASHAAGSKQFCSTCDMIICVECAFAEHKLHEVCAVSELKQHWQKELSHVTSFIAQYRDRVTKAAQMLQNARKDQQKVCKDSNNNFAE